MSTGNSFGNVRNNFYRCRLLGLAWASYQTFCWVAIIFLSPTNFYCCRPYGLAWLLHKFLLSGCRNVTKSKSAKTHFFGKKIWIFKIFEKISIVTPFREVHANFYRCRPLGLAWALYQIFCWVAVIFLSPNVQKRNFWGKKFEFPNFRKNVHREPFQEGAC